MSRILITGATGNVGFELIRYLTKKKSTNKIVAGVRNIARAKMIFENQSDLEYIHFDFEDFNSYDAALDGVDRLFLLRPPHISDVRKYFKPLILKAKEKNICQIVFLSVQGAEASKVIPHNKIERLIKEQGFDYIFLRPSYFMQNLTTTLLADIQQKGKIILPSGKAKFNWVDIENIAEVGAILLNKFDEYKNQTIEITGLENESFHKVVELINNSINRPIEYVNVNPLKFFRIKRGEGMKKGMVVVMILLHFLPRFQKEPKISDFYNRLTGKQPTDLKTFIQRENFEQLRVEN